jgi:FMN phosphatase YigB (HAD superfamily)
MTVGLVSNSHRSLSSFASHFKLDGLITAAVSSSEHGLMKPHPSIFRAALALMGIAPSAAVMVGDSVRHDVEGGMKAGMRAVLLHRSETAHPRRSELLASGVSVISSLRELPALLLSDEND